MARKGKSDWERLCKRYDVTPMEVEKPVGPARRGQLVKLGQDDFRLSSAVAGEPNVQEIGQSGIRYIQGTAANTETNPNFRPVLVRGGRTRPGTYHNIASSHPIVGRWIDDISDNLSGSQWEVTIDPPKGYEKEAETLRQRCEAALDEMDPDLDELIPQIIQCAPIGFTLFEPVYHPTRDLARGGWLKKVAHRHSHAVKEWIWDEEFRELQGAQLLRGDQSEYTLEQNQLAISRWRPDGDDPEGNSPLRAVARIIDAERLLLQIQMSASERKGAGFTVGEGDVGVSDKEADEVERAVKDMLAAENPYAVLPPGWRLNLVSPQGQIPDFDAARRSLHELICIRLATEYVLVGMGDTGAYALADAKNEEAHAKTQAYAKVVERFFNSRTSRQCYRGLLVRMVDYMGGPVQGVYPQLKRVPPEREKDDAEIREYAVAGLIDWTQKDEARFREDKGLEPLEIEETPAADELSEDNSTREFNGAQVTSLSQVIKDVAIGDLPKKGAIAILKVGFGLSEEQAQEFFAAEDPAKGGSLAAELGLSQGCSCCGGKKKDAGAGFSLAIDQKGIEDWLRASEGQLGKALRRVAGEHRATIVTRLSGVTSQSEVVRAIQAMRPRWLTRYENAVRGEIMRMVVRGSASVMAELGIIPSLPQVPADSDEAVRRYVLPNEDFRDVVDATSARIALHAINLTESYLLDREIEETSAAVRDRLRPDIPKATAFAKTAGTYITEPFTYGRDQVAQRLRNMAEARGFPDVIVAERSSVLDGNTCDVCERLDGRRALVGSPTYDRLSPPKQCEGGRRCRCIWTYITPDEAGFAEILDALVPNWRQEAMLSAVAEEPVTITVVETFLDELFA